MTSRAHDSAAGLQDTCWTEDESCWHGRQLTHILQGKQSLSHTLQKKNTINHSLQLKPGRAHGLKAGMPLCALHPVSQGTAKLSKGDGKAKPLPWNSQKLRMACKLHSLTLAHEAFRSCSCSLFFSSSLPSPSVLLALSRRLCLCEETAPCLRRVPVCTLLCASVANSLSAQN